MYKKYLKTTIFFIILGFVITAIAILFLPDKVPMHYNFYGQIDRYGSKYELFLFPVITVFVGVFLIYLAHQQDKKGNQANSKTISITNLSLIIFFNLLNIIFIFIAYKASKNELLGFVDGLFALMAIIFGIFLIVLGLIMPKTTLNGAIGLRTKWSMYNENTWKKSQKFGGITFVIQGLIIIILSVFLKEQWPMIIMLILLFVDIVLAFLASYLFYKQEKENEIEKAQ